MASGGAAAPADTTTSNGTTTTAADKLLKLKQLLDIGAITQAEFEEKKAPLLDQL